MYLMTSPSAAVVDWPNGISSVLMNYYGLNYQFKDREGVTQSGTRGSNPRFFIGNLQSGKPVEVNMEYKIVPIVNREPILDTLIFKDKLVINMPTSSSVFPPIERDILLANGVTTFTADGVSEFEELVYPVHANSLQDIFYFPNLKRLDLTGGDLFSIPQLKYEGSGIVDYVGGGDYEHFMRKAGNVSSGNQQALKDLLESGILQKVYYYPNSMGLDDLLMPYVESGVVELLEGPSSILIDNRFHLDGRVQSNSFNINFTYPATDAPAGEGLENIYKLVLKARSASFVFALPKEYQLNAKDYKYLNMKIYAPSAATFEGIYEPYKCLWPRFMNHMWSFGGNSTFGQQYWAIPKYCLDDNMLEKWVDVKLDLSQVEGKHTRVIILNIGAEPSLTYNKDIVYYFSNIRFTKE